MFAVTGLSREEVAAGPQNHPWMRLAHALERQSQLMPSTGAAERVLVYGVDATDVAALEVLRQKYREYGEVSCFAFFNDVAQAACDQFGIELRVLEYVNEEEVPASRAILVDSLYARDA